MKKKILIVDDDVQFVETIRNLLEAKGFDTPFSYKPQEGFELAKKERPDLIILDVMFAASDKGLDGFDIARNLHGEPLTKTIPVIMVSGVRKVLNLPFQYEPDRDWKPFLTFLEKPVRPDKFLAEIQKALEKGAKEGPAKA